MVREKAIAFLHRRVIAITALTVSSGKSPKEGKVSTPEQTIGKSSPRHTQIC
ncbi:MAG: hypothetical protein KME25_03745 [Symplocastrum torsivum CPER-KK1]|uniref:Uncharacterized protein n=1 Tax=Symplocastrum torsivum CPER-KK1 TaxID=450513 RepID=A0A951PI01_9CYAN|nr:hypothetical protein [Symplocastrum torsivum CPER-KK1]